MAATRATFSKAGEPQPLAGPLADLHRHLDGSLRPSTLRQLCAKAGLPLAEPFGFFAGMGLQAALDCFRTTLRVLQFPPEVQRVASEICEDAQADGVTTLEVRFAPQLHTGASVPEIVDAALAGLGGRAGLVLCGLYGEPPAVLETLLRAAETRPDVVGIDLAGGPATGHRFGMGDYRDAFAGAARMGLGRTVHAGEGRPPEEIAVAVTELQAQRIGHGCTLLQDEEVVRLVVEKGVTVEVCATSNVHVGVFGSARDHPMAQWLRRGVRACICTDNTLMSRTTASQELRLLAEAAGMTPLLLSQAIAFGHAGKFVRLDPNRPASVQLP